MCGTVIDDLIYHQSIKRQILMIRSRLVRGDNDKVVTQQAYQQLLMRTLICTLEQRPIRNCMSCVASLRVPVAVSTEPS